MEEPEREFHTFLPEEGIPELTKVGAKKLALLLGMPCPTILR